MQIYMQVNATSAYLNIKPKITYFLINSGVMLLHAPALIEHLLVHHTDALNGGFVALTQWLQMHHVEGAGKR